MQEDAPTFSWKKALLFAAAVFVLFLALSVGAFTAIEIKDPQRLGEGLGRMSVWVFALAALSSYGLQTRKKLPMILGGVGVLLCVLFVASIFIWAPS